MNQPITPSKIGVSLSGGAARGIAHLGVLQALEELDIRPSQMAGISSGAIVAALYAYGYAPRRILDFIQKMNLFEVFRFGFFRRPGLFTLDQLDKTLRKYLPNDDFAHLKCPLNIGAADLISGELKIFNAGELIRPIMASCCLPVIFNPVRYQGYVLVDGGVVNTLMTEEMEGCDHLIGVHCNPLDPQDSFNSTVSIIGRCLNLSIHANARYQLKECQVVIEPEKLHEMAPHRIDKAEELFDIGYQATMHMQEDIKRNLGMPLGTA